MKRILILLFLLPSLALAQATVPPGMWLDVGGNTMPSGGFYVSMTPANLRSLASNSHVTSSSVIHLSNATINWSGAQPSTTPNFSGDDFVTINTGLSQATVAAWAAKSKGILFHNTDTDTDTRRGTAASGLQAANNLSDVSSASTARTNLGLGTIATKSATSGSGVQKADGSGGLTTATNGTDFVQPGCVLVEHNDGTRTRYPTDGSVPSTDALRHAAWLAAINAGFQSGDTVHLGPGTYDNTSADGPAITVANVSIIGAGRNLTILKNSDGNSSHVTLYIHANNCELRNLQVLNAVGRALEDSSTAAPVDGCRIIDCLISGDADSFVTLGTTGLTNFYSSRTDYVSGYDIFNSCIQGKFENCTFTVNVSTTNYQGRIFHTRNSIIATVHYPSQIVCKNCTGTITSAVSSLTAGADNTKLVWFSGTLNATFDAANTKFVIANTNASNAVGGACSAIIVGDSSVAITIRSGCSFSTTSDDVADSGLIYDIDNGAGAAASQLNFSPDSKNAGSGSGGALVTNGTAPTFQKIGSESLPALSGDVTSSAGSAAVTVTKINGTSLGGLSTGLLKNTTSTGVPSIASAGTDYLAPTGSGAALTGIPLLLFTQTADGSASNTSSYTTIASTGTGSRTLPANFFTAGKTIAVEAYGVYSATQADAANLSFKVLFDSTSLGILTVTQPAVYSATDLANKHWRIRIVITCRTTGAGGTMQLQGECQAYGVSDVNAVQPSIPLSAFLNKSSTTALDTTTSHAIDLQYAAVSGSSTTNESAKCTNLFVYQLN